MMNKHKIVVLRLSYVGLSSAVGSAMATAVASKLNINGDPQFNVVGVDLNN